MIIERRICDFHFTHDNGETHDSVVTRTIVIDKRGFEIDVCNEANQILVNALDKFIAAGRRAPGSSGKTPKSPTPEPAAEPTHEQFLCSCGRTFDTQRGLTRHTNHPPVDSNPDDHQIAA